MKKLTTGICAAMLSVSMAVTALAAPSIGELIPEAPAVVSGEIPENEWLIVQNVDTEQYSDEKVADVVTKFNADKEEDKDGIEKPVDVLKALDVDLTQEIKTNKDNVIDPEEYDALMPFADLAITDGVNVTYKANGKIEASFKLEVAKDLKQEDLVIMMVDPETGEVYFIEIDEYDPETGEITAEFPCLGPFLVMTKGELPESVKEANQQ